MLRLLIGFLHQPVGGFVSTAIKLLSLEEFLLIPEEQVGKRAQYIDGQIVQKAEPSGEHGDLQSCVSGEIREKFKGKGTDDGMGGWWLKTETSIHFTKSNQVRIPDISGWKRARVPEKPKGCPVRERPDWVCEIAVSTLRSDLRETKQILELEGVPFYWVVDAANDRLVIFELSEGKLIQTAEHFKEDGLQRLPPFQAAELDLRLLFGDDPE
jgi:Uma2 family endonuclease